MTTPQKPKLGLAARIGLIFGGFVVLAIWAGLSNQDDPAPVAQSAPTTATAAPRATYVAPTYTPPTYTQPPAAPTVNGITSGTYEVGVDIEPGKYKTAGPADTRYWPMCYWARLKDTSGELGSIIANDNIRGQTTVTIKPGDGAFETNGCQPWVKVD